MRFFIFFVIIGLLSISCTRKEYVQNTHTVTNGSIQTINQLPEELMVLINGGTFLMGSETEQQHQVSISSFYISKYEITQREFEEVMGINPSKIKGPLLQVSNVTWFEAIEYCNRRSEREGLNSVYSLSGSETFPNVIWNRNANGYRLPTESEWEFACRAGTTTPYNTGDNLTTEQANISSRYNEVKVKKDVGSYAPNGWGLHDMHGNVNEWCWDWYHYYPNETQINPVNIVNWYFYRIYRGGSSSGLAVSSAARFRSYPDRRIDAGFRVAHNISGIVYSPTIVE